jgi:hypothetical protein
MKAVFPQDGGLLLGHLFSFARRVFGLAEGSLV